jgi:hypothetical protein
MRIIAAAIAAFLSLAPAFAADAPAPVPNNWSEFRDPTGVFSVQFPQPPVIKTDSTRTSGGVDIPIVEYQIDRGSAAMIVMIGDFSTQSVDPQAAVNGAVHGVQTGRTLLTDQADVLDGQTGRFVTLSDTDGNHFTDRIFFIGSKLYQAITVVPKEPLPGQVETVTQFTQSLHFLAH